MHCFRAPPLEKSGGESAAGLRIFGGDSGGDFGGDFRRKYRKKPAVWRAEKEVEPRGIEPLTSALRTLRSTD